MGGEGHSYHFIYTQHISDSSFLVPLFTNFLSLTLLFLPCRRPPAPSFTASHICRYVLALEFCFLAGNGAACNCLLRVRALLHQRPVRIIE